MNRAIILGNLIRDPESRVLNSGVSVCSFIVAVNRRFANQQGARETDFIPVVAWRGGAESCARFLRKGSKVAVCGTIQTRSYDAQDGTKRYVTEIVADEVEFLDAKGVGGGDQSAPLPAEGQAPSAQLEVVADDGDLPF